MLSTIELWQFPRAFGLMNPSPFCMKIEVFLRLARLEYRCKEVAPWRMPKGKLPVLQDGETQIPDSEAIIHYLQKRYKADLPPALCQPENYQQLALRRMLEEHTYFILLRLRWQEESGWRKIKPIFFNQLPRFLRMIVPLIVRHKICRDLCGQGIGRHQLADLYARAFADIDTLAGSLATKKFFAGDTPGTIDACVYAFLAQVLWAPFPSPIQTYALGQDNLLHYAERMKKQVGLI